MDKQAEEIVDFMHDLPGKITEVRKKLEQSTDENREKMESTLKKLEKQYQSVLEQAEELEGSTEKVWDGFHESLKKSVHEIDKGLKNILNSVG